MNYNETSQWAADLGSGYSSIRPLGEGGMGTLYRAHKDSLDVDVVIKRVKQKFKGRMDERAEANILKTLKHKYLPRIYDVIESPSGYVYTIMDMIPGENMQNYVKTHGPVSQKLAYRWACQLCEVIAYLHSQVPPILHCDIKPSNIMITPNEDICVIDFNTSLVFSKGVLAIGATPGYAAPEQYTRPGASPDTIETVPLEETMPLRGYKDAFAYQNVRSNKGPSGRGVSNSVTAAQATNAGGYGTISKRTDVYGIGATLYYAITGQQPGHSLKDVRPITSYKLKFSRSFLLIIARAMMKRQEERFCDAQEMLRALQDMMCFQNFFPDFLNRQLRRVNLAAVHHRVIAVIEGVIPAIVTGLDSNIAFSAQFPCTYFILCLDFRVIAGSIALHDLCKLADVEHITQSTNIKMILVPMFQPCRETSAIRVVHLNHTAIGNTVQILIAAVDEPHIIPRNGRIFPDAPLTDAGIRDVVEDSHAFQLNSPAGVIG